MRNFSLEHRDERPEPARAQPARPVPPAAAAAAAAALQRTVAVLGPTLRFKGEISAEEDFILQGRIEGSIQHTQSVTIGTDGAVVGNIHARMITIDGNVEGDLHGTESVIVNQTGRVTGNIFAPRVGITEGAFFNGRVEMSETRAAASSPRRDRDRSVGAAGVPLSAEETERMMSGR